MSDALNAIVDRTSANHGSRTAVAAVAGRGRWAASNFVAVTFALSLSILPSAKAIDPADALKFAVSLPSLMLILPLSRAEPLTRCGMLVVADCKSGRVPMISKLAGARERS